LPSRVDVKTMRRPSGAHAEAKSLPVLSVSRRRPVPSAFITMSAKRSPSFASKLMCLPSGDHAGA
jgi:hypothetical protein